MLPISDVIFGKKENQSHWVLYDIYKIAIGRPLEVNVFGTIFALNTENETDIEGTSTRLSYQFQGKSSRLNLQGISLNCGLVVSRFHQTVIKKSY